MTFFSILETLLIGPLKLVFEIIFGVANSFVGHPGLSIIFLSLVMNILVLPLYRRADAMQEAARDIDAKLHDGVAHIKKTFSGDERMMILQTYYRQNNYKPTDALRGSVSLLLEIPFFMAAYQFLSHLEILDGVSLGPIKDLSAPDGLIVIGNIAINFLPILMTLINIVSSSIYLKGFPRKTKVQLYAMAIFFLVFLYTSPSGLVFYWTLNNLFSFFKNIFYKIKNPQKVLRILTAVIGVAMIGYGGFIYETTSVKRRIFLIGIGVILLVPIFMPLFKKIVKPGNVAGTPNKKVFTLGCLFITVLTGLLIPTTFIAASPQEYVDISYFHHPLWYVVSSAAFAAGFFLIWFRVFYWLASDGGKVIFEKIIWIMSLVMVVNYMFFGLNLGNMSSTLKYDNGMSFALKEQVLNIIVIVALSLVALLVIKKWKNLVSGVLIVAIIALGGMSVVNINTIRTSVNSISSEALETGDIANFDLSTEGQNVVVIMLDRAVGTYVPYLLNERPELKEQFDGFTYFPNVVSFSGQTNFSTPAIFGGYEYTPVEMNKRDDELLVDKHNEALKVMPVIFDNNDFDVTVCDPVYANYQWIPDLSVFDEYPDIDAYITEGVFGEPGVKESVVQNNHRNFFCFSIMKTMPVVIQPIIYEGGRYRKLASEVSSMSYDGQKADSIATATGVNSTSMKSYNALSNLSNMTRISNDDKNTYMFLSNNITHEPMLYQTPDYIPSEKVDNTAYNAETFDKLVVNGEKLLMENNLQVTHYHANMAAFIQLGKWFDYLRENGVYDNTRIILVSDHGAATNQLQTMLRANASGKLEDISRYVPLLMIKDFNSKGVSTYDGFMTIADVPVLAMNGLIENPVNPFTGKVINSDEKTAHRQYITMSAAWDVSTNNGYTFLPSKWMSVEDDIYNKENWEFYSDESVLKEHAAP